MRARRRFSVLVLILGLIPAAAVIQAESQSLSVEEAVRHALRNSYQIRIKQAETKKKEYAVSEKEALRYPRLTLNASASYMTNPQPPIEVEKGSLGTQPILFPEDDIVIMEGAEPTYFRAGAELIQPIFTWGKIKNAIELTRFDLKRSWLELEKNIRDLERDVRKAYFSAVLARMSITWLEKSRDLLSDILTDRNQSFEEGLITYQQVLEAKSNFLAMETRLVEAQESYESAKVSLVLICSLDTPNSGLISPFRTELPALNESEMKARALERSADLAIVRNHHALAQLQTELEKSNSLLKPDLSLVAAIDVTGERVPVFSANWTDTWRLNVIFSIGTEIPLWDSLASRFRIRQAEEGVRMAGLSVDQVRQVVGLEVRKAVAALRNARYDSLAAEAMRDNFREQLKNAEVSFENELITREEMRSVQLLVYTYELEYLFIQYSIEAALTDLEYLSGEHF